MSNAYLTYQLVGDNCGKLQLIPHLLNIRLFNERNFIVSLIDRDKSY